MLEVGGAGKLGYDVSHQVFVPYDGGSSGFGLLEIELVFPPPAAFFPLLLVLLLLLLLLLLSSSSS